MMTFRCFAAVVFLAAALVPPASGQATLQWRFRKGETFCLETTTAVKITYGRKEPGLAAEASFTKVFTFKVVETGPRGAVLEQRLESVKIGPKGGSFLQGAALAESLRAKVLTFTLNRRGEITKVGGFDDLLRKVCKEQEAEPVELEALLTEEGLRQEVQLAFLLGPAEPARAGDTWKRQVPILLGGEPVGFMGKFQVALDFRYEGRARDGERVVVRGSPRYVPPAPGATIYPYQFTKGKFRRQEAKGEFVFDPKSGRLVRQEFRLAFEGTFTQDVGGRTEDMDIGQELTFGARLVGAAAK